MYSCRNWISFLALEASRARKSMVLCSRSDPMKFLDLMVASTREECEGDWRHALAIWAEGLLREPDLGQWSPDCLQFLEGVWLDEVKERMAYRTWLAAGAPWSTGAQRESHYYQACQELSDRLVNHRFKLRGAHGPALQHLESMDRGALVLQKAWKVGSPLRAQRFVQEYYDNIALAITEEDEEATRRVVAALDGCPELVSALEMLVATAFLDEHTVLACRMPPPPRPPSSPGFHAPPPP